MSGADGTVSNVTTSQSLPSDHHVVLCDLNLKPPAPLRKTVRSRSMQKVDVTKLYSDIESSSLHQNPPDTLDDPSAVYNSELSQICDEHAPVQERQLVIRHNTPWYTDELRNAKQERRRLERRANKATPLQIDKELYRSHCKLYNDMLNSTKEDYFRSTINDANQQQLFRVVDSLTSSSTSFSLPDHTSPTALANKFADFFRSNIQRIREQLNSCLYEDLSVTLPPSILVVKLSPNFVLSLRTRSWRSSRCRTHLRAVYIQFQLDSSKSARPS